MVSSAHEVISMPVNPHAYFSINRAATKENLRDHIPDSPAKQYAGWYHYYKLEPPAVDTITDESRAPEKLKKKRDWLRLLDTPEYGAAYEDYCTRLASFQARFLSDTQQTTFWEEDGRW